MGLENRHKRMGLIVDLEGQLSRIESRLKGIKDSITDALFVRHSYLDLNADDVLNHAKDFKEAVDEGIKIRNRLEELESE